MLKGEGMCECGVMGEGEDNCICVRENAGGEVIEGEVDVMCEAKVYECMSMGEVGVVGEKETTRTMWLERTRMRT